MVSKEFLEQRLAYLKNCADQAMATFNGNLGAIAECELLLSKCGLENEIECHIEKEPS